MIISQSLKVRQKQDGNSAFDGDVDANCLKQFHLPSRTTITRSIPPEFLPLEGNVSVVALQLLTNNPMNHFHHYEGSHHISHVPCNSPSTFTELAPLAPIPIPDVLFVTHPLSHPRELSSQAPAL